MQRFTSRDRGGSETQRSLELDTARSDQRDECRRAECHVRGNGAFAAPPMNLLGPELVRDLVSLIQRAETNAAVQVVVFKSADPDYFISHVDVTRIEGYRREAAKRGLGSRNRRAIDASPVRVRGSLTFRLSSRNVRDSQA
jgi:hypothetical protein